MNWVRFEGRRVYPSKVICVGRNYHRHIKELNNKNPEEIVLFIKPNSSVTTQLIKPDKRCRYEGEISFLLKDWNICGVGFGIDLTLIDEQNRLKSKGLPWEKAKAFDNSAVFSDFTQITVEDVPNLKMELYINGELIQKGSVKEMIYSPEEILQEVKNYFSIYDYDILMCGTPEGVGQFEKGDIFTGRIILHNRILIEKRWTAE